MPSVLSRRSRRRRQPVATSQRAKPAPRSLSTAADADSEFDIPLQWKENIISIETNISIAKTWLDGFTTGRDPDEIAAPFAEDLVFEIQGDDGVMPWMGRKTGRSAMAGFARDYSALIEPLALDVEEVLASENRAVIVGSVRTRAMA